MRKGKAGKLNITGPVIRRLRKSQDLTQSECAIRLREAGWRSCTRSWISRVESGEVTLRDVDLPFLRIVFGEIFLSELNTLIDKTATAKSSPQPPHPNTATLANFIPSILLLVA